MKIRILSTVALMLLTAACTTAAPSRHFDDIPLPSGLTYQPQRSVVIESPSIKAAKLVYRGRLEPGSLGDVMRSRLESTGWRPVSRTTTSNDGTVQVYEKDGNALEVHIYEGLWYTYLVVTASEPIQAAAAAPSKDDGAQTTSSQTTPQLHTSVDPPATPGSGSTDQPARTPADPSFTQRVKNFFTNLLSW